MNKLIKLLTTMLVIASFNTYASTATLTLIHDRSASGSIVSNATSTAVSGTGLGTHTFTVTTNDPGADVSFIIEGNIVSNDSGDTVPAAVVGTDATQENVTADNDGDGIGEKEVSVGYDIDFESADVSDDAGEYTGTIVGTLTFAD